MRRQAAVVVVAVLVLLSGCSLFGGGTPAGSPNDQSSPTDSATPTPTPTPTPVPYPNGYSAAGIDNASAARAGHLQGLLATSNFSLGYNATFRDPDGTVQVTVLQAVAPDGPRALTSSVVSATGDQGSGAASRTLYYANGTQYVRTQRDGNTSYGTINRTLPAAAFTGRQYVDAALTNVTYDEAERFERAGETFFRFRSDGIDDPGALLSSRIPAENVTGGNVSLVVDRDGVVRTIEYHATVDRRGDTVRYTVQFAVAGIDRSPVPRPEWAQQD